MRQRLGQDKDPGPDPDPEPSVGRVVDGGLGPIE